MRKAIALPILLISLFSVSCGDSTTTPTLTPAIATAPAIRITGHVSQFEVIPSRSGKFGDINFEVTVVSNLPTNGCFIEVRWLTETGLQVESTFAGSVGAALPAGTSKVTDSQFVRLETARRIKDSRVEFSLCR